MKIVTKHEPFNQGRYRIIAVSLQADDNKTLKIWRGNDNSYALCITDDIGKIRTESSYILNTFDTFEEAETEAKSIMDALEEGKSVYKIL